MKIFNTIFSNPYVVSEIKLYKGHYHFYLNDGRVVMFSQLNNIDWGFLYSLKEISERDKTRVLKKMNKVWKK